MGDTRLLDTFLPDGSKLKFGTDLDIQAVYNGTTNRLEFVDPAGNVLAALRDLGSAGELTVFGSLNVQRGTGTALRLGADYNGYTLTDSVDKGSRFTMPHYLIAEEDFGIFYASSSSTANVIILGGGSSAVNAATSVRIYTAPNTSTTTGTLRLAVDSAGLLRCYFDAQVDGALSAAGGVTAGVAGTTRGVVAARSGAGGAAPGCLLLVSKNGTVNYFFVTDAGVLRRHTSLPTADTDGTAV